MKYLKHINDNKIEDEFIQDIKDILLEAEDYGYTTKIFLDRHFINIIDSRPSYIKFNDIKDCLLRIKDYLGDRYKDCEVYLLGNYCWISHNLNEDSDIPDNNLVAVSINYK